MGEAKNLIQCKILGSFDTVHVPGEDYGEIDPSFFHQFQFNFEKRWRLIDAKGKCHRVHFNGDYSHPLLTKGWRKLRGYYLMEGVVGVRISYHGLNIFQISIGNQIVNTENIPFFHSCSTTVGKTIYFDKIITSTDNLVFDYEMYDYICRNGFEIIVLCGIKGRKIICCITSDDSPQPLPYILDEWNIFCIENDIKVGDRVRFKFAAVNISHMVFVFKAGL